MRLAISVLAVWIVALLGYLAYVNWWPSAQGAIVVISDPPGAQIWVDLKPTDVVTNGVVRELPDGKHSVTVRLDTLLVEPFAQVVQVSTGQVDTLRFVLRPRSSVVPVRSRTSPVAPPPNVALVEAESLLAAIPTAADLRAARPSPDTTRVPASSPQKTTRVEPTAKEPSIGAPEPAPAAAATGDKSAPSESRSEKEEGSIQISSSEPGAKIFINDRELEQRTPATVTLPFGTYAVRVESDGYKVTPDQQPVRISRASSTPFIFFSLEKSEKPVHAFTVQTTPIEGRIFVDGVFVGEGAATCERDYGTYLVTFGDVDGWHTPKPERMTLTPSKPNDHLDAHYIRLYHAFAEVNNDSRVAAENISSWSVGIIFEDGKPQASELLGPRIREIPSSKKFGWELAMGDPNRNPTGGDYVLFTFTLPEDVPPDSPLNLRLYVYRSDRKYPWTISGGHSELDVRVNDHRFLDGFTPQNESSAADLERYEEWSLHSVLKPGENHILVSSGDGNTMFNYLWKVEIL
jgi:hypothetical protein